MPRLKTAVPKFRLHKPSGRALVTLRERQSFNRWRDAFDNPITFDEFRNDPTMPAVRRIHQTWDRKLQQWVRSQCQSGEVGVWRVALIEPGGRVSKFYGRAFDTRRKRDQNVLLAAIAVWGEHDFGDSYLALVASELRVVGMEG